MFVCMYVCMYVCMQVCVYVCMYMYVYVHVCMYTCVYMYVYIHVYLTYMYVYMYVCMHACICMYMYGCMSAYYVYVCMLSLAMFQAKVHQDALTKVKCRSMTSVTLCATRTDDTVENNCISKQISEDEKNCETIRKSYLLSCP